MNRKTFLTTVAKTFEKPDLPDQLLIDAIAEVLGTIERLEAVITRDGIVISGSRGQPVTHPAVAEARQQRLALGRLLTQLGVEPDTETTSQRQRRIANARWQRPPTP